MHKLACEFTRSVSQLRITLVSVKLLLNCSIHHNINHTRPAEWHNAKSDFEECLHETALPNEDLASCAVLLFMALATAVQSDDEF